MESELLFIFGIAQVICESIYVLIDWLNSGVVSYYLFLILETVGITSVTQQTLLNGFLNVWNLLLAVCAALFIDIVGRRKLFLLSCAIMLVAYIIITALSGSFAERGSKAVGIAVSIAESSKKRVRVNICTHSRLQAIPFLFVFNGGYGIAFTPISTAYMTEIWPFALRTRGVALYSMVLYMALLYNLFVNPIALAAIAWKYHIVFISILLAAIVTIFFTYPETRGYTLEGMAIVFDREMPYQPRTEEETEQKTFTARLPSASHEETVVT